jgi:hypothetical protein
MIKTQIYSHYKLPITMNPLKFGKLLDQTNNKFIVQLTTRNVAVINQYDKENFIKFFKNGDLVLEFRDKFISDNSFSRLIGDTKFTFINERIARTEVIVSQGLITIYSDTNSIISKNNPLYKTNMNLFHKLIYYIENSGFYKNYKAELFILFKLFLIFCIYIIFFVIFPEVDDVNISLVVFSKGNITKLRKVVSDHK